MWKLLSSKCITLCPSIKTDFLTQPWNWEIYFKQSKIRKECKRTLVDCGVLAGIFVTITLEPRYSDIEDKTDNEHCESEGDFLALA